MTIASEIARINGNISDAYNSCAAKGATMPVVQNSAYLADTINSITGGGGGDTDGYVLGVGKYYIDNGVAKSPQAGDISNAFKNISIIDSDAMKEACANMYSITGSVDFSNLQEVWANGLQYCFENCYSLNGDVNLPKLEYASSSAFFHSFNRCFNIKNVTIGINIIERTWAFSSAFGNSGLTILSFPNLHTVIDYNASTRYNGAYGLANIAESSNVTFVNFPNLENVAGTYVFSYAFNNCRFLNDVNFEKLQYIGASSFRNAFQGCISLQSINLPSLKTVRGNGLNSCFYSCSNLKYAYLNSVNDISYNRAIGNCFAYCSNLMDIYFNGLTSSSFGSVSNQFSSMLIGVNGCNVHFPAAIQSTISGWSDVTSGFGGTNTTVLFDL